MVCASIAEQFTFLLLRGGEWYMPFVHAHGARCRIHRHGQAAIPVGPVAPQHVSLPVLKAGLNANQGSVLRKSVLTCGLPQMAVLK